jgi:hypothetical protein
MSLPNTISPVSPFDIILSETTNEIIENIESLAAGTGLDNAVITYAKLLSTIFSSQLQTQANAGTAGGTMSYINLGGIKLLWCIGASGKSVGASGITYTFTLPTSFFSTITFATSDSINQAGLGEIFSDTAAATTTTVTVRGVSYGGAATTGFSIFVIGT